VTSPFQQAGSGAGYSKRGLQLSAGWCPLVSGSRRSRTPHKYAVRRGRDTCAWKTTGPLHKSKPYHW